MIKMACLDGWTPAETETLDLEAAQWAAPRVDGFPLDTRDFLSTSKEAGDEK